MIELLTENGVSSKHLGWTKEAGQGRNAGTETVRIVCILLGLYNDRK